MNHEIHEKYREFLHGISASLCGLGFQSRGEEEFWRSQGEIRQRFALSLRELSEQKVGFVEVFPGFNIPKVEALAASLQGKKPREGFITCSLNVGLLTSKGTNCEWLLRGGENVQETARIVMQTVVQAAIPFWSEFSSLEHLVARFEVADYRVCRGTEWPWRQVASCCLLGQFERARELLNERLEAAHNSRPIIESALQKVSQMAGK